MTFKPGFVLEQTLGHVTHSLNLKRFLNDEVCLEPEWIDVPFQPAGWLYKTVPLSLNWSLRGSLAARNMLAAAATSEMHAMFVHTLTVSLLASKVYERVPTVLSTDATPINVDSVRSAYAHRRQPKVIEGIKRAIIRRVLQNASAYVSWSQWAKDSLVRDYGVASEKVEVIAPGADLDLFAAPKRAPNAKTQILFVGGDFARKGGDLLLQVHKTRLEGKAQLHLVTGHDVAPRDGVFVYRGITANSPVLLDLFQKADIFALPTRADCLAMVLGEAMAASLPIVTTSVGAHAEAVEDGRTGLIVEPGDVSALGDALEYLVENPTRARLMGEAGRQVAEERFDARANAKRIVRLMESCR